MQLSLRDFTTLVEDQAAATQAVAAVPLDYSQGSVMLALAQGNASVALWMQWLSLMVLGMTRAATSQGSDLDSWVGDFSVTREPAVSASGLVTFARAITTQAALVVPGANVITADGTQTFTVTTDTTNTAWSTALGGYQIAASVASINVPVLAQTSGAAGNVGAGTITLIGSAIPYVDTVTNGAAFTNGINAETDTALRARFANYIQTRSLATKAAVEYAVLSVQQGLTETVQENTLPNGTYQAGFFTVTVDDGSGSPSSSLIALVSTAVDLVRPLGSSYAVQGPSLITAAVALTITAAAGYIHANLVPLVQSAITAAVDALPLGSPLYYGSLYAIAYGVPGVAHVSALTVNGATADLGGGQTQVVRISTVTVS